MGVVGSRLWGFFVTFDGSLWYFIYSLRLSTAQMTVSLYKTAFRHALNSRRLPGVLKFPETCVTPRLSMCACLLFCSFQQVGGAGDCSLGLMRGRAPGDGHPGDGHHYINGVPEPQSSLSFPAQAWRGRAACRNLYYFTWCITCLNNDFCIYLLNKLTLLFKRYPTVSVSPMSWLLWAR